MIRLPLTYLMKNVLIMFLILLSVALVMFVLELSSKQQATTPENLSSGFPTKRVLTQSPPLYRLARKLKFRL